MDSEWCDTRGETLTNMSVFDEPERAFASMCVSFELRYGTCFAFVDIDEMTSPRADSDLLMFCVLGRSASVVQMLDERAGGCTLRVRVGSRGRAGGGWGRSVTVAAR